MHKQGLGLWTGGAGNGAGLLLFLPGRYQCQEQQQDKAEAVVGPHGFKAAQAEPGSPVNTRVATIRPTVIWKRMEKSIQRVDSVCVFTMMAAGTHGG